MNTCRTCAHWVDSQHKNDFGEVMNERANMKYCVCPKIGESMALHNDPGTDLMIYSYNEGGEFSTGPDFGCVHHREAGK